MLTAHACAIVIPANTKGNCPVTSINSTQTIPYNNNMALAAGGTGCLGQPLFQSCAESFAKIILLYMCVKKNLHLPTLLCLSMWRAFFCLYSCPFSCNQNFNKISPTFIGRLQVPNVQGIIERLLLFLESGCDAVVSEALIAMKDLLRRYPDVAEVVVAQVRFEFA